MCERTRACVCLHTCMYVCVCVCAYMVVHACVHVCVRVCTCACVHVCAYMCARTCVCVCVCAYTCVCACLHVCAYMCVQTCARALPCVCVGVCAYMCVRARVPAGDSWPVPAPLRCLHPSHLSPGSAGIRRQELTSGLCSWRNLGATHRKEASRNQPPRLAQGRLENTNKHSTLITSRGRLFWK